MKNKPADFDCKFFHYTNSYVSNCRHEKASLAYPCGVLSCSLYERDTSKRKPMRERVKEERRKQIVLTHGVPIPSRSEQMKREYKQLQERVNE